MQNGSTAFRFVRLAVLPFFAVKSTLLKVRCTHYSEIFLYSPESFDVFLAENRTEIVGAVFVLYYEKVPDMQINNGKVGVPVNFFIQPSYKKTDLAKCLLSFAVECTLEKEVRLFEMAVPKESVGFYMELGFVQMELVALQAYIKHDA